LENRLRFGKVTDILKVATYLRQCIFIDVCPSVGPVTAKHYLHVLEIGVTLYKNMRYGAP